MMLCALTECVCLTITWNGWIRTAFSLGSEMHALLQSAP